MKSTQICERELTSTSIYNIPKSVIIFKMSEKVTKVSMFSRIRRSFRRKKESYCINCGHVTKSCYHSKDVYENVEFSTKDDFLKWLDLDYSHGGTNNNAARLKYKVIHYKCASIDLINSV